MQSPKPTDKQVEVLRQRREYLEAPGTVLEILRRHVSPERPHEVGYRLVQESANRFTLRVDTISTTGAHVAYALTGYVDDRSEHLWRIYAEAAATEARANGVCPVCLPVGIAPELGLLIFPWIEGETLHRAIRSADVARVRHAAAHTPRALVWLHSAGIVPASLMTPRTIVDWTWDSCARLVAEYPEATSAVQALQRTIEEALPSLEPSSPTFVHGVPGPAHLIFDRSRWVLLDLDRCGYADPAYDIGYLLAAMERGCVEQPALAPLVPETLATLRAAYTSMMPRVSTRNISFYQAVMLTRQLWMTSRQHADDPMPAIQRLARRALDVLGILDTGGLS